jgi:hypothetical protein
MIIPLITNGMRLSTFDDNRNRRVARRHRGLVR